jgi:predicted transposase YbfD/YdcC
VLTGARSIAGIAEWAADAPQPVRAALGARRDAPDRWAVPAEATIRRTLARLDPEALAGVVGAWLADRDHPNQHRRRRAVAVDGKTLCGARSGGRQVHLLAAIEHATRAVLAQRAVDGTPGEIPGFQPLLEHLDLAGAVVTADALQTNAETAQFLVGVKQADYLFVVKANQPALLDRCHRLAWHHVPVLDRTRDQAHGRVEIRTLKVVSVRGFGFPHAAQVLRVTRKTRALCTRSWRTTTVYAVTSLTHAKASPARLADYLRGHWGIEALHHIRDTTFAEDASQLRTGSAPQVMAALRNLVIGILSRAGPVNLAAALRHHSRNPYRPLATLGISLDEPDITQERWSLVLDARGRAPGHPTLPPSGISPPKGQDVGGGDPLGALTERPRVSCIDGTAGNARVASRMPCVDRREAHASALVLVARRTAARPCNSPALASARPPARSVRSGRGQRFAGRRRGRCCPTGRKTMPTVRPECP